MALGFGFGMSRILSAPFTPKSLFSTGAQGVWYDPSDLSTLYQDAAGTTPVTAVEQPVGLMLDKSKGLVLSSELVTNGDFSSSTRWTLAGGWSISGGKLVGGNAGNLASQASVTTSGSWYKVSFDYNCTTGISIRICNTSGTALATFNTGSGTSGTVLGYFLATGSTVFIEASGDVYNGTIDNFSVKQLSGNHAFQTTAASRPVLSARYNLLTSTETLATQSVTTRATTQKLTFTGTGSITLSGTATGTYTAGTYSFVTTAGTLTLTVSGSVTKADLRASNESLNQPTYQRVNTSTDYDTVGFKPYLLADGVDDGMVTNSIDFTATDKMTVCAGVRKLSGSLGIITELSASSINTSMFGVYSADGGTNAVTFFTKGTLSSIAAANNMPPPISGVVTGIGNIGGDQAILRINGTQAATSSADQGTGNYGNYPLYLFRRGGATLPFNGRMYEMTIVGKTLTDGELVNLETYTNQKTGAY